MTYLHAKRQMAKEWLERLKKSFQMRAASRGSSRKIAGQGEGQAGTGQGVLEKVKLSDMKMMVEEGALIVDQGSTTGTGESEEIGEDKIRRVVQSANRELTRAQTAVEIAEEWIERVKQLLQESYADLDKPNAPSISSSSSSGGQEEERDNVRELLRDMLSEVDEMPVQMDEASILRVHLKALDWAVKAKKLLPYAGIEPITSSTTPAPATTAIPVPNRSAMVETVHDIDMSEAEVDVIKFKPSYADLQKLVVDIKKLVYRIPYTIHTIYTPCSYYIIHLHTIYNTHYIYFIHFLTVGSARSCPRQWTPSSALCACLRRHGALHYWQRQTRS